MAEQRQNEDDAESSEGSEEEIMRLVYILIIIAFVNETDLKLVADLRSEKNGPGRRRKSMVTR